MSARSLWLSMAEYAHITRYWLMAIGHLQLIKDTAHVLDTSIVINYYNMYTKI